ncbi:MAG TPA: DUF1329 domain-containing protein [Aliidongia sp.]|uniref:DUF1329 domain-containing protein n=1 Tax=Aliidongia sp. TaxID=1914230 RepID=UPI002DDCB874|nr:DUF1329 domain-containing protein [Aliidongia sp.]HEV2677626.1 DUF1329 domain-containing protein [Aliidongia sp.]
MTWALKTYRTALLASALFIAAPAMAQTAADLGKTLTPMGAIKAGNADKTIPAYEGGIATPPAGYKPGDHLADPFAAEKPLAKINAANMAQYADKLTEGQKAMLARYPDFFLNVYPTHRTAAMPKVIEDAAIANASSAKLTPDGNGVEGAKRGVPFPIPKSGLEAIWNHLLHFTGFASHRTVLQVNPTEGGDYTPITIEEKILSAYASGLDTGNIQTFFEQAVTGPARLAGEVLLVHDTINQVAEPRQAWTYNPGQRRVRRAPNVAYDNPGTASDGLRTNDQFGLFNGSPDRYDWKLIGRKELYVPYNDYKLASDTTKSADAIKPKFLNPDLLRFELHRVWVVEATLKPGVSHLYAKRVFYLDEDTWRAVTSDSYDQRGQLWRVGDSYGIEYWQVPASDSAVDSIYDLQSGRYTAIGFNNESAPIDFSVKYTPEDFTPETLRNAGVR